MSSTKNEIVEPRNETLVVQNSRYNDGTTKVCYIVLSLVPYRVLQSGRCLVIAT
jgi:hypothetical protein